MAEISRIVDVRDKIACVTLDFETDYGDRIGGEFNIRKSRPQLQALADLYAELKIPVTAFVRTDMLTTYPDSMAIVKQVACDFHCHSHTHNTQTFDSPFEISATAREFEEQFGTRSLGYRAPQGVLYKGDIELLKEHGFEFSSSVFPSFRPGKYSNTTMPLTPFVYDNGIVELPFAVIPSIRYTISLSYLKLLGFGINRMLYSAWGLPNVVVFDSHLHDYIVNEESFGKLPRKLQWAWGVNKNSGMSIFRKFVDLLRQKNYRFMTATELYHHVKAQYGTENSSNFAGRAPVSGVVPG